MTNKNSLAKKISVKPLLGRIKDTQVGEASMRSQSRPPRELAAP
jgi:hypothetical protein